MIDGVLRLPAATLKKVRSISAYLDFRSRCANHIPTRHDPSTSSASLNDRGTFSLTREYLALLAGKNDPDCLERIGGVGFVAISLETDPGTGIRGDDEDIRRRVVAFGTNSYTTWPFGSYFLVPSYLYKVVLRLLLVMRVLVKCLMAMKRHYTEGVLDYKSILAPFLGVLNPACEQIYEFWLERQCMRRILEDQHRMSDVIRNGRRKWIPISDVVVGDVVFLKAGHRVPADGLLIDGWVMLVYRVPWSGNKLKRRIRCSRKPFLHAGNSVTDGIGTMLVTVVGSNCKLDEQMGYLDFKRLETQAWSRMERSARKFGVMGLIVTSLLLVIARNFTSASALDVLAQAYTSVPSCWHLISPLSLASYLKESLRPRLLLKNSRVIETMSFAKSFCLDITGVLTTSQMLVTDFWLGLDTITEDTESLVSPFQVHFSVLDLIIHGLALNTAGSIITRESSESPFQFSGSPMEIALLSWASQNLNANVDRIRQRNSIIDVTPWCMHKLRSIVVAKNNVDGTIDVHSKGDAETVLELCSHFYAIDGTLRSLNAERRTTFHSIIQAMSAKGLRCLALAQKKVSSIPRHEGKDFSLLGIFGIRDQCRSGAKNAVGLFQHYGLDVKLITSDNIFIAKAIATECGILDAGEDGIDGVVVEGSEFRRYTPEERLEKVDRIRVLVGSTPEDKLLMIKCLKRKGPVVAITGGGIDDQPKEEDVVGISMYFCGTELSQESSDIVVLDDDLTSVMDLLRCSRSLYHNFRKIVEFQLTFIVSALAINSVCVIMSGAVALTEVHLLWAKTIIFFLGHAALTTQKPANYIHPTSPRSEAEPLITNIMWRNVIVLASYQVIVLVFIHYKGKGLFGVSEHEHEAFLFNVFILCQLFNLLNFKLLEGMNILDGAESNKRFFVLLSIVVGIQAGGLESANWTPRKDGLSLSLKGWGATIAIVTASYLFGRIGSYLPVPEKPFLDYLGWKRYRPDLERAENQNPVSGTPFMEYLVWCIVGIKQTGNEVGDAARQAFRHCKEMTSKMGK